MEVESTAPFKAPPLSSVLHMSEQSPLPIYTKDVAAEAIMPDDAPHSPIERAEAEAKISIAHPTLHYTPPSWASIPETGLGYKLEIVKNGTIIACYDLDDRRHDSYVVIGRLPNCDIVLEHPSISRYHCILQYGEDLMDKTGKGWHVYDLGSTHGSKANKNKLPPKQYLRIRVGFVLQFGGSSRIFSLLGPAKDCEPEWELSPTEMREEMQRKANLAIAARKELEAEKAKEAELSEGIDWGMHLDEDLVNHAPAVELELDGHLMEDREQYYQADPKKALSKFFEREGFDMKFELSEQGSGHSHKWLCTIELPIEINGVDRSYTAQATVSTSKKDAQIQCALEACRILDSYGVLRSSNAKARAKRRNLEENDFYDEDDDEYLDRTGDIERQREKRRMWAKHKGNDKVEKKSTYESLCKELEETRESIAKLKAKLEEIHAAKVSANTGDSLDDYCRQLSQGHGVTVDMKAKTETSALRQKLVSLTHDAQRLEKLVKIAKPVALPDLKLPGATTGGADKQAFLRRAMMVGRKQAAVVKDRVDEKECSVKGPAEILASETFRPEFEVDEQISSVDDGSTSAFVNQERSEKQSVVDLQSSAVSSKIECCSGQADIEGNQLHATKKQSLETEVENPVSETARASKSNRDSENALGSSHGQKLDKRSLSEEDAEAKNLAVKKTRRSRVRSNRHVDDSSDCYGNGMDDDRYATWLPPDNQSGDGRTALNAKFEGRY